MKYFAIRLIAPFARKHRWRSFCEIGASNGETTDELLKLPLSSYTIIDPCFDEDLPAKYRADPRVAVFRMNSLDALTPPELLRSAAPFDCMLIDGDHNWYTVFNELSLIHEHGLLRPGSFIFLHDVNPPWARRDLYYQPKTIPAEFRHPYASRVPENGKHPQERVRENGLGIEIALDEGGSRNGVLTAIEDFLAKHPGSYRFFRIETQFGLGVIQHVVPGAPSMLIYSSLFIKSWVYANIRRLAYPMKQALKNRR